MRTRKDIILARVLLERGFVDETQLKECQLAQQVFASDPDATLGTTQTRPLMAVLLERGLVKEDQVSGLLDEQNRRLAMVEQYERMVKAEMTFGQLLVKHNKATQLQINKCVELQRRLAEQGKPIPRLGELMVEHGFVDARTAQDVLRLQHKELLHCTGCGKQFNVIGLERGKTYKCKACGGVMVVKERIDTIKVDETAYGFELPTADGPSSGA
ncbi:MAG: hypothetical protein HYY16_05070 [Planctomycetes bacterium]|nr:hypothetical protein [Planctomycetota bacterium]